MADSRNMELNDEMMEKANGGTQGIAGPKYEIGDKVQVKVIDDSGIATTVDGFIDDRRAGADGWEYLVRYEAGQEASEKWSPNQKSETHYDFLSGGQEVLRLRRWHSEAFNFLLLFTAQCQ